MKRSLLISVSLLVLLTGLAASASPETALGPNGVVFTLTTGNYGDLFPGGNAAKADTRVLKLQADSSSGRHESYLVPGSEGTEVEVSASLVVEESSDTVYLVWQSWYSILHSRLYLSGFGPDGWLEPIEISNEPFAMVSSPRLAVTRDEFDLVEDGQIVTHQRTVLHLVWVEEGSTSKQILYAPVFLLDGKHVAMDGITNLSALVAADDGTPAPAINDELLSTLTLRTNNESHSVTLAFTDSASGQVISLDLQVVAGELTSLADDFSDYLSGMVVNEGGLDSSQLRQIADRARAHLIDIGYRIHPALLNHLAAETQSYIASQPAGTDSAHLIAGSRAHLIDIGAQFDRPGIRMVSGGERAHLIDIGVAGGTRGGLRDHQVRARVAARRQAPSTGSKPQLYVSSEGTHLLVSWQSEDGSKLLYRESRDASWSTVNALNLGNGITLGQAESLLERRVEGH